MTLTAAQSTVLRADIIADVVFNALPINDDTSQTIANAYNANASPAYTVWKNVVPISQVGDNFDAAELGGLTTADVSRLQVMADYAPSGINPSMPDRRLFFDDIFSGAGGTITRGKLATLWRRLATRGEKLFASGAGSDVSPSTMTFVGLITRNDVNAARAV